MRLDDIAAECAPDGHARRSDPPTIFMMPWRANERRPFAFNATIGTAIRYALHANAFGAISLAHALHRSISLPRASLELGRHCDNPPACRHTRSVPFVRASHCKSVEPKVNLAEDPPSSMRLVVRLLVTRPS